MVGIRLSLQTAHAHASLASCLASLRASCGLCRRLPKTLQGADDEHVVSSKPSGCKDHLRSACWPMRAHLGRLRALGLLSILWKVKLHMLAKIVHLPEERQRLDRYQPVACISCILPCSAMRKNVGASWWPAASSPEHGNVLPAVNLFERDLPGSFRHF